MNPIKRLVKPPRYAVKLRNAYPDNRLAHRKTAKTRERSPSQRQIQWVRLSRVLDRWLEEKVDLRFLTKSKIVYRALKRPRVGA
jgi:hypothetical protein